MNQNHNKTNKIKKLNTLKYELDNQISQADINHNAQAIQQQFPKEPTLREVVYTVNALIEAIDHLLNRARESEEPTAEKVLQYNLHNWYPGYDFNSKIVGIGSDGSVLIDGRTYRLVEE